MQHMCMKCSRAAGMKEKVVREMVDVEYVTMKNGRRAAKGKCGVCGSGMYKIVPKEQN
ncbi:MAG: DUF5679 domain-containing protein [Patescibacteria group bacterium]